MQNDKVANLVDKFQGFDLKKKILAIILLIVIMIFGFFVVAKVVGQILLPFNKNTGMNDIQLGLSASKGFPLTCIVYVLIIGVAITSFLSTNLRNEVERSENGIHYAKDKSGGTSRWMTDAEVKENFNVGKINESTSTIYGKMRQNSNDQVVTYRRPKGAEGNRNTLVVASMGSGKTYTYVINELIQTILRGDSFVCTDPKGELFTTLAEWCKEMGVEVHLLNLDPEHVSQSEFWNCLQETIDPKTERLDPTKLSDFVNIYMQNSGDGKVDFWYNSALNLVKAATGYVAYKHEFDIVKGYVELYKKVNNDEIPDSDPVVDQMNNSMCSFVWCKAMIRESALKNGYNLDEVDKAIYAIENQYPKFKYNIGEVFDVLLNFTDYEEEFENIPEWHSARTSYLMYKTNDSETVRKSALQGAQLRFTLFQDPNIKNLLSYDGINLKDINLKQSAYFVIVSDKVDTLKPISSLFFSFFFKDVLDNYDKQKQLAESKGTKNPCLGVTAMLEEFFSIGVIGANPEAFGKTMATCRSRKLYVSIIIQYIAQLEALYGKYIKDSIQGGCATLYYLGGNDQPTLDFISNFAGSTTVVTESHQEGASAFSKTGSNVNVSTKARALVTPEDARRWRNRVLLVKQWCQPVKFYPFGWDNHWVCYKGKGDTHPNGTIHLIPEEITNADGTKVTLWNVASDSFTSYDDYISPIATRVTAIKKYSKNISETELHGIICGLDDTKTEISDIAPNETDELAETELIWMDNPNVNITQPTNEAKSEPKKDDTSEKNKGSESKKGKSDKKNSPKKEDKPKKDGKKTGTKNSRKADKKETAETKESTCDNAKSDATDTEIKQSKSIPEPVETSIEEQHLNLESVPNEPDFEPDNDAIMDEMFAEMMNEEEQSEDEPFDDISEEPSMVNSIEETELKETDKGQVQFDLGGEPEVKEKPKNKSTSRVKKTGVNKLSRTRKTSKANLEEEAED